MARLAPENMITQTYGLYAFTGKSVSFLGPLCFAAATDIFDSQRAGMATIIVLACRDGVAGEGKGIDWTRLQARPAVSRDQVHAASRTRDRRGGNRSGIPRRAATEKKRQAAIHAVCPRSVGGGIPYTCTNGAWLSIPDDRAYIVTAIQRESRSCARLRMRKGGGCFASFLALVDNRRRFPAPRYVREPEQAFVREVRRSPTPTSAETRTKPGSRTCSRTTRCRGSRRTSPSSRGFCPARARSDLPDRRSSRLWGSHPSSIRPSIKAKMTMMATAVTSATRKSNGSHA